MNWLKQGVVFVQVKHFSKYGLLDDSDDEAEMLASDPKKLKLLEEGDSLATTLITNQKQAVKQTKALDEKTANVVRKISIRIILKQFKS